MLNRPLNAVMARLVIVAAALALLMLVAPAVFADSHIAIDYPENADIPVETFSATDPDADADDIEWDLEGPDADDFEIDGGVLTFEESPDFEMPTDRDEVDDSISAGDQGAGDNVYKVTVLASGGKQEVEVTVTDEDEPGEVEFNQPQPQATRDLKAKLTDEDGDDSPSWQWSRGASMDGPWTDIEGAITSARKPTADDVGSYLRATVTYEDKFGEKTVSGVTGQPVEGRTLSNAAPEFDDEIDAIPVKENVKGAIGDPIVATDDDNDVLLYDIDIASTTDAPNDNTLFKISETSGQLSLKDKLNFESPGGDPAKQANDDGVIVYTVVVRAKDPSSAPGMGTVEVHLEDVNELPEFSKASREDQNTLYIAENDDNPDISTNKALSATVAAFLATDNDGATKDGDVDYDLEFADDKDEDKFEITEGDGVLTSTAALTADFEDKASYSIVIVASTTGANDNEATPPAGGNRGTKYGRLAVTVKVVDGEDSGTVALSSREPQVGRAVIATLTDKDGGETAISWQWYRGGASDTQTTTLVGLSTEANIETNTCTDADGDNVASPTQPCVIDGAKSALYTPGEDDVGHLLHAVATYKDNIAFDQDPNTDGDQLEETARGVSERDVETSDPANTAPAFPDQDLNTAGDQSDTAMRSVEENKKGAKVGEPITSGDADDDLLLYTISGDDAGAFKIDKKDGQLTTAEKLDFETKDEYMVMVTATDPSGATDSIMVTIMVTDEDDGAVITQGTGPTPEDPGSTCGMSDAGSSLAADCETLLSIMDELVGDGTAELNWDEDTAITEWVGVAAGTGRVAGIWLPGGHAILSGGVLAGTLPAGITALDALARLTLTDNDLTGEIPDLTGLDNLTLLVLGGNAFTGGIPASLGNLDSLLRLWLHRNEGGFEGGIPAELGNLSNIRYLMLYGNGLTGEIPSELGNATNLKALYLHNNMLTGSIPAELGNLMTDADDTVRLLYLHNNMLSGDIPAELGNLTSLTALRLSGNMLTGCIPAAIADAAVDADRAGLMACAP